MTVPHYVHVIQDNRSTLQVRDQNIFRPMSNETRKSVFHSQRSLKPASPLYRDHQGSSYCYDWVPPLYRNTSLLSSPSRDMWAEGRSASTTIDENSSCTRTDIPADFLPPRHLFSHGSHEEADDSAGNTLLPSHSVALRESDVVCGRGANTMTHPGNQEYRELIKQYESEYIVARRIDKPVIATQVIGILQKRGTRFVRREKDDQCGMYWVELPESKVYEKVCQSLREGAPELRRKLLASDARKHMDRQRYRDTENYSPIPCY